MTLCICCTKVSVIKESILYIFQGTYSEDGSKCELKKKGDKGKLKFLNVSIIFCTKVEYLPTWDIPK